MLSILYLGYLGAPFSKTVTETTVKVHNVAHQSVGAYFIDRNCGCCGRSHPDTENGKLWTKTIGGILKQQLNDLLHGGRDIPDKAK